VRDIDDPVRLRALVILPLSARRCFNSAGRSCYWKLRPIAEIKPRSSPCESRISQDRDDLFENGSEEYAAP